MNRLSKSSVALISLQNVVAFAFGVFVNKVSDQIHLSWPLTVIIAISLTLLSIVLAIIASLKAQESESVVPVARTKVKGGVIKSKEPFFNTKYYALLTFAFGDFSICGFLIYGFVDRVKMPFYPLYWYLGALSCAAAVWSLLHLYASLYERHLNRIVEGGIPIIMFCILSIIGYWML